MHSLSVLFDGRVEKVFGSVRVSKRTRFLVILLVYSLPAKPKRPPEEGEGGGLLFIFPLQFPSTNVYTCAGGYGFFFLELGDPLHNNTRWK